RLVAAVVELDRDGPVGVEPGIAHERFDAIALEERAHAGNEPLHDRLLALDHGRIVNGNVVGLDAVALGVPHSGKQLRAANERLGRNAADVQAHAADVFLLDTHHAGAELSRADRRDVPSRAGAYDGDVFLDQLRTSS